MVYTFPRFYYNGLSCERVLLLVVIVFVFLKKLVEGMNVHILEFYKFSNDKQACFSSHFQ